MSPLSRNLKHEFKMIISKTHFILLFSLLSMHFGNSQSQQDSLTQYIPEGHFIVEKIVGDLNKDGIKDCVLMTKASDKSKIVTDEYRGELDRNRRGITILFKKDDAYEIAISNSSCFSSENEDGGVYFAPELSINIKKGILHFHYSHGRYGYWRYAFRYQNGDFELIGYDSSSSNGPVVSRETSINFSTKRKQIKKNTYTTGELEDPVFEETWEEVQITELIKLSEIKDFDELDVSDL